MSILQAVILGLVQGITEFLPVSSSAHLVIIPKIFDWKQQSLTFDIIVHAGTLLAILYYYRSRIFSILKSLTRFKEKNSRNDNQFVLNILIATIPTFLFYFFLKDYLDDVLDSLYVIKFTLISVGILLIVSDLYNRKLPKYIPIKLKTAFILGIGQGLSLIRGVSRSGAMLTLGLFAKSKRSELIEFVLLTSVPVILGGLVIESMDYANGVPSESLMVLLAGFITSAISGLFAIKVLNKFASKNLLIYSGIYRILIALVIFML